MWKCITANKSLINRVYKCNSSLAKKIAIKLGLVLSVKNTDRDKALKKMRSVWKKLEPILENTYFDDSKRFKPNTINILFNRC